LLKICVLPFLLSTIPSAVRSAMVGGTAGRTIRSLIVWLLLAVAAVAAASALVASVIYHYLPAANGWSQISARWSAVRPTASVDVLMPSTHVELEQSGEPPARVAAYEVLGT
jgi:hypothetical protein